MKDRLFLFGREQQKQQDSNSRVLSRMGQFRQVCIVFQQLFWYLKVIVKLQILIQFSQRDLRGGRVGVKGVRYIGWLIVMGIIGSYLEWMWYSFFVRLQVRFNSSFSCSEVRWSISQWRMWFGGFFSFQRVVRQVFSRIKVVFWVL